MQSNFPFLFCLQFLLIFLLIVMAKKEMLMFCISAQKLKWLLQICMQLDVSKTAKDAKLVHFHRMNDDSLVVTTILQKVLMYNNALHSSRNVDFISTH